MPLFNDLCSEDQVHVVNFLWNSPSDGLFYINKIVWNSYGDSIKLSGIKIQENSLSDLNLEVHPRTSNWTSLYYRIDDYQTFYHDSAINQHIFGELSDYMSMYID